MQHEDAENIGYVIPTPVMEHFINDYERNGQYTAFPSLGIEWQKMESPFLRKALGMLVGASACTHPFLCHTAHNGNRVLFWTLAVATVIRVVTIMWVTVTDAIAMTLQSIHWYTPSRE